MSYIELTSENFNSEVVEEKDMPVLVDFWAPWCGPCQILAPTIEDLADELDGQVKICKLNCDEAADYAMLYGVMSIPCMILFNGGEEKNRLVGLQSKGDIVAFIDGNK